MSDVETVSGIRQQLDRAQVGAELYGWIKEWYPTTRSITGEGVREQLERINQLMPLQRHEVPSGTQVFDWTVPNEWNIRDAWVKNAAGERVVDFQAHNLHVMSYSVPVHETMSLAQLREHCFTLPEQPDLIPYRTSYYKEAWGICLSHAVLESLPEGEYEVCINSTLAPGHLSYGECVLPGEEEAEVLFSSHICHPSLANDNLSAVAIAVWLARTLGKLPHRYTYRFVFAPGTIGAITWLAQHVDVTPNIQHGLILALLGNEAPFSYKKSRKGNAVVDEAVAHTLAEREAAHELYDFTPYGYDERQYNSPGFKLPVGCLMRSRPGTFPEYHTSADNLDFVKPEVLADSVDQVLAVIEALELNRSYRNLSPFCEPQLGKRGLYSGQGKPMNSRAYEMGLLWMLNFSDGEHSLLDIARKSGLPLDQLAAAAQALEAAALLQEEKTP